MIMAIDTTSYRGAATATPRVKQGAGLEGLAKDPNGVLVIPEVAKDFEVKPGDELALTVFPDDKDLSRNIKLRVAGIVRAFPPTNPPAEMIMSTRALPPVLLQQPDFYLARTPPGADPRAVAGRLERDLRNRFAVTTISDQVRFEPRSLTALNLGPLGDLEFAAAALVAAVGVGVLGAFVVLERRRELAILKAIGADDAQVRTGPAQEGAVPVVGALAIGIPVGLGLGLLSVRLLGLFFTLPAPALTIPLGTLAGFVVLLVATSAAFVAVALVAVDRVSSATELRGS
jgi:putative ABC transport system permease protein